MKSFSSKVVFRNFIVIINRDNGSNPQYDPKNGVINSWVDKFLGKSSWVKSFVNQLTLFSVLSKE